MNTVSRQSQKQNRSNQAKVNSVPSFLHWRFVVVVCAISLVFVGLGIRAAYIQVISPDLLIKRGDNRTLRTRVNPLHRGLIVDRNGQQLEDIIEWLSITKWSQSQLDSQTLDKVQDTLLQLKLIDAKIPLDSILTTK